MPYAYAPVTKTTRDTMTEQLGFKEFRRSRDSFRRLELTSI